MRKTLSTNRKQGLLLFVAIAAAGILAGCGGNGTATEAARMPANTGTTAQASVETTSGTLVETAAGDAAETTETAEAAKAEKHEAAASGQEKVTLLVAAAASLKNAYEEELIPMFEAQNPGVHVEGVYDSSGRLQTQIEEGLEADVFMSAATKQMNALDEEGMIASGTMVQLLENRIVLIVPEGGEDGFSVFEDIASADSIALGDPDSVPAGQYAKEALTALGIWDGIQDRISLGTNVTEVLNQVAAGSAAAGIVYATDAASMADQVTVVAEAPEGSLKERVLYPVAVVKDTAHKQEAEAFVEFLQSAEALEVFAGYGFADGR